MVGSSCLAQAGGATGTSRVRLFKRHQVANLLEPDPSSINWHCARSYPGCAALTSWICRILQSGVGTLAQCGLRDGHFLAESWCVVVAFVRYFEKAEFFRISRSSNRVFASMQRPLNLGKLHRPDIHWIILAASLDWAHHTAFLCGSCRGA